MYARPLVAAAVMVLVAGSAAAEPVAGAPNVSDLSYRDAAGRRVLQEAVDVDAAPEQIWALLTTDQGLTAVGSRFAHVDLRVGGTIETSYQAGAKPGDAGNIKNQILAYAPNRMLAIRNIQAPPRTPFDVATFQAMQTITLIEPLTERRSRVTTIEPDFLDGPTYDGIYRFFRIGNGVILQALHDHFAAR